MKIYSRENGAHVFSITDEMFKLNLKLTTKFINLNRCDFFPPQNLQSCKILRGKSLNGKNRKDLKKLLWTDSNVFFNTDK